MYVTMPLTGQQQDLIRAHLKDVLRRNEFSKSEKLQEFLRFIVEAKLADESVSIKEADIAHKVYGRKIHDPRIDAIVRTEAARLREKLKKAQRPDDAVVFEIPKGYTPDFGFRSPVRILWNRSWKLLVVLGVLFLGTGGFVWWRVSQQVYMPPKIEFTVVPHYDDGGPVHKERIAGTVSGISPKQYKLVIYSEASNGITYIELDANAQFTTIKWDGTFDTDIYLGETYDAILVKHGFKPEPQLPTPPQEGGDIVLVAKVRGKPR